MSKPEVAYQNVPSREFPHLEWLELHGDSILHECAIMRRDALGNLLYFRVNDLDDIDKQRLVRILASRNARQVPLFDLMSNHTLGNGVNALVYFTQLVKQLTPGGKILDPRSGQVGGTVRVTPKA